MKKILIGFTALITLLSLAGCDNIFQASHPANPLDSETGFVRLEFSAGRTVLPSTYTFDSYKLTFKLDDDTKETFTELLDEYELAPGSWTLDVEVFITGEPNAVAKAKGIPVTISKNETKIVPVSLNFELLDGDGRLSWAITNNTGKTPNQLRLTLKRLDKETADWLKFGTFNAADETVGAGHYLATISFEVDPIASFGYDEVHSITKVTGAKRIVWSDVVHIYPNQVTSLAVTFGADDFFNDIKEIWLFGDMTDWNMNDFEANKKNITQENGTFYWEGDRAAETHFKFALTNTSGWTNMPNSGLTDEDNKKTGAWFVAPTNPGTTVQLGDIGNEMRFLPLGNRDISAVNDMTWKLPDAGYYQITVDPVSYKFYVNKPMEVTEITIDCTGIDDGVVEADPGNIITFTATVLGKNIVNPSVDWTIVETPAAGTTLVRNTENPLKAVLTISPTESANVLHIRATSTASEIYGEVTVSFVPSQHLTEVSAAFLEWDPAGTAKWAYTDNAKVTGYEVQLYKNSVAFKDPVSVLKGVFTHSFLDVIKAQTEPAEYTFTVTALGGNVYEEVLYTDSEESAKSPVQAVKRLPTAVPSSWNEYAAVWANGSGDTTGLFKYEISLYRDGVELTEAKNTINAPATSYNFQSYFSQEENAVYTFTVKALSNNAFMLDAIVSEKSPGKEMWNQIWLVGIPNHVMPGDVKVKSFDNTFTWTAVEAKAGNTFRFNLVNTTNWNSNWFIPKETNEQEVIAEDKTYEIIRLDNSNPGEGNNQWKIKNPGTYTFTVDPVAMTLYVEYTAPVITDIRLVGTRNNWVLPGDEMESINNNYIWEGTVLADSTFRFSLGETDVWTGDWLIPAEGNEKMVALHPATNYFTRVEGNQDGKHWKTKNTGNYKFTVNPEAGTLTAVFTELSINDIWLVGSINDHNLPGEKMSKNGTAYTKQIAIPNGGGTFRFSLFDTSAYPAPENPLDFDIRFSGMWFAPATNNAAVTSAGNTVTRINGGTGNWWKINEEGTYTVTLTLAENPANSTFTVTQPPVTDIWLRGSMTTEVGSWAEPGDKLKAEVDGKFTWEGYVGSNDTFRFSLKIDGTNSFVPENNDDPVSLASTGNPMIRRNSAVTGNLAWSISDAGWYMFTVDPVAEKFVVTTPPKLKEIVITSPANNTNITKSGNQLFTVDITCFNMPEPTIDWNISGTVATAAGTQFTGNTLYIDAGEANTSLTITASSGSVTSNPVTVKIVSAADFGGAIIELKLIDEMGDFAVSGVPSTIYKTGGTAGVHDKLTITVTNPGSNTFSWYVDGVKKDNGNSIIIDAKDYFVGYHTVRLVVVINDVPWSKPDILSFEVKAVKE